MRLPFRRKKLALKKQPTGQIYPRGGFVDVFIDITGDVGLIQDNFGHRWYRLPDDLVPEAERGKHYYTKLEHVGEMTIHVITETGWHVHHVLVVKE